MERYKIKRTWNMTIRSIEDFRHFISTRGVELEKMFEKKGCEWDYSAKTFEYIGADNLDIIEVMMDLENQFDCVITDDLCDLIMISNPNDLLLSVIRQRKIDELGIN